MIKGIIFDMDGVLVDNSPVHVEAFVIWCKSRNIDFPPERLTALFGMGNDDIMKVVMGDENLSKEQIDIYANEKEAIYRDIFAEKIRPLEGLIDILKAFKAMGMKIAVGSSGMRKNVNFVLEKCGITDYFDAIADGDMITKAKPDPQVFLLAADLLGLKAEQCLVFEDSFAGIAAARAARMPVVAVATTYTREQHTDYDAIIDNFTQITAEQVVATQNR